jgi:hypothetical protein
MLKRCHKCESFVPKGKIYGLCINPKQSSKPMLVERHNGCEIFLNKIVVDRNVGGEYKPELDIHWEDTI